jgi:hypothetical protein
MGAGRPPATRNLAGRPTYARLPQKWELPAMPATKINPDSSRSVPSTVLPRRPTNVRTRSHLPLDFAPSADKEIAVKKLFSAVAAACCVWSALPASAQYTGYATQGRPTGPMMAPAGYGQPALQYGRPQASVAMRPTTNSYAAQPVNYQFKPVNPPSQATQRLLLASKNTPTPAPPINGGAPVRPVSNTSAPPQQYWNSSATNAQPWVNGNTAPAYGGGASYGPASYGPQAGGPIPEGGDYAGGGGECCGGGGDACGSACGGCCCFLKRHCCGLFGGCCHRLGSCLCVRSTGDMAPHMPFFGTTHGYYYFRPYHVMHVFSQQELATRWGGDARNPYDNSMFQKVYEQMGVAATLPAVSVAAPPSTPDYVVPNGTNVVPTPVPSAAPAPNYNTAPQYNTVPNYNAVPQYNAAPQYTPGSQYSPMPNYMPGQNVVPNGGIPGTQPGVEYLPPR